MQAICLFVFIYCSILALMRAIHLSPEQMYSARGLLLHPQLTSAQRSHVQNLLYRSHEKWAIKKAKEFKQFHKYKCGDISLDELVLSGKMGLFKSSRKYDGRTGFTRFAEIYVKSELIRTMTSRLSFTNSVSRKTRMAKNTNATRILEQIDSLVEILPSQHNPHLEHIYKQEYYSQIWGKIGNFDDAFTKRVFWLKYDREFKSQRSNADVAELMCCSEEYVRQKLQNGVRIISEKRIE